MPKPKRARKPKPRRRKGGARKGAGRPVGRGDPPVMTSRTMIKHTPEQRLQWEVAAALDGKPVTVWAREQLDAAAAAGV